MIVLKVYDKSFSPLIAFVEGEFSGLQYSQAIGEIGDSSFALDLSNSKVTEANLRHYNRVEVLEDGTVLWAGFIARKTVRFNIVEVRCKGLIGILKKRLVGSAYTMGGPAGQQVSALLAGLNATEDTGISFSEEDVSFVINQTFERQDALSILNSVAAAATAQFEVTSGRQLNFKTQIGRDLSGSVVLRYNVSQVAQANILKFEVDDDGDAIVTKGYGKSGALGSTQEDTTLKANFGLLETFRDFRVANLQADVDGLTRSLITGPAYSPAIDLASTVTDNFSVGDTVRVQIRNKLIDLDDAYQIMEKSVRLVGKEKFITVKVNQLSRDIMNEFKDLKTRLSLLESNV